MYKIVSDRTGFVDDVTKALACFGFAVTIAVHLQNANAKFHKVVYRDIIQARWKTFKLLYHKFIQDNVYQIWSELTGFSGRYDKNILVCFFRFTV